MRPLTAILTLAVLGACLAVPARAAQHAMRHGPGPADQEYQDAMRVMAHDALPALTGDPDTDFVLLMKPHHQAAVDMAKVELRHGRDPALRKMAQDIIAAQNREIAEMDRWLADRHK